MQSLSSNRVAALAAFISGLAGAGTSLAAVWPSAATNEIALIAGTVLSGSGALAHIVGSILWDRTPAGQVVGAARAGVNLVAPPEPIRPAPKPRVTKP